MKLKQKPMEEKVRQIKVKGFGPNERLPHEFHFVGLFNILLLRIQLKNLSVKYISRSVIKILGIIKYILIYLFIFHFIK